MKNNYFLRNLLFLVVFTLTSVGYAQSVSGTVSDDNGPLPGANVIVKGTSLGVTTDFDGNYTIGNIPSDAILLFSFVGYLTQEVEVNGRVIINITLQEDANQLDEVVVIGYGTQKKSTLTGAIESVSSDDFSSQPMVNAVDALQGRAAGVFVGTSNGAPGGDTKIVIRGSNSILGSSKPLVVIDGILGGSLESLNPDEIASFEVLKDASSTAIFGSQGANGVILVTTKNGRSEVPIVSFNSFYGLQKVSKKIDLMSASVFAEQVNFHNIAFGGDGDIYSDSEISQLRQTGGTDWQDELFRTASTSNIQLSVSGKSKKVDYYLSGNYVNQDGIIIYSGFERFNFRAKANVQVSNKVRMGMNMSTMKSNGLNNQNQSTIYSPVYGAIAFDPTTPVYDEDGNYNLISLKNVASLGTNPLALQLEQKREPEKENVMINGYFDYEIIDGLVFNITAGSNTTNLKTKSFKEALTTINGAVIDNYKYQSTQITSRLTYEKDFNNHNIKVDAIYETTKSKGFNDGIYGEDISFPATTYNNIGLANVSSVWSSSFERALQSIMGRLHYSFKDKYIFTVAVRNDGSSVLAEGNKFHTYPSGAVAWRLSEEDFLKDSEVINELKLRASYGITGNQSISPYQSYSMLGTGGLENYPFDDATAVIGAGLRRLGNSDLRWESTAQFDVGVDMAFLNNRFGFVVDYYKKSTSDLLMAVPIAPYRGPVSLTANVGDIENTGFEIGARGTIFNTDNFRWDSNFNIGFNETIVTGLGDDTTMLAGGKFGAGLATAPAIILEVGEKTGNFYGFIYEGVWKSNEASEAALFGNVPGDAKYRDLDGNHVINNDDLTVMGNGQPDFTWGFNNSFQLKSFDLNIFFQGVHGNDIWNLGKSYTIGGNADARNATSVDILNRWTPENENTDIPAYSPSSVDYVQSSRYVEDGSYVKLRNISLGYNLPESTLEKTHFVRTLRVYISGQDLLTFTNYSGYDPEISNTNGFSESVTQSIDYGAYPTAKTVTLGVNITF